MVPEASDNNTRLRTAYLWPFSIEPWRNATPYQRVQCLSRRMDLCLFLPAGSTVPRELLENCSLTHVARSGRTICSMFEFAANVGSAVRRLHKDRPFDLVYTSHFMEILAAMRLRQELKIPWVVDIFDDPGLSKALVRKGSRIRYWRHVLWEEAQKRLLRRADLVVCGTGKHYLRACRIPRKKLLSVTNGVDLEITRPVAARCSANGAGRIVCYVGFVSEDRGAFTLAEACAQAARSVGPVELHFVGPCEEKTKAILLERWGGAPERLRIDIPGRQPHERVLELIGASDACVFPFPDAPELAHIYPIKVYEYLAMGKAVVASDLPGVRTIISDGANGLLFKPGDAASLRDKLVLLLSSPSLCDRLQKAARPSVERFDWQAIHDRIVAQLRSLVREGRR